MRRPLALSGTGALAALLVGVSAFAQAPGFRSAVISGDCDHACLIGFARGYMSALQDRDPSRVKFASDVRFTENNVEMPLGKEGLWATVTGIAPTALEAADTTTGEAAWIGTVEEHGLPVYYGMRLKVRARAITEVETVVVRTTGLPLPFGDVKKIVHDPSFAQVLPQQERRSRERLMAVADSYFSTVELNDGTVFAPFDPECGRLENGILTTAAGAGSAGDTAQGCEAQFRLGLYRINKRIRERRYPLIDVERGVVVATGFFDHANEFDTYKTTDGKDRKTLLKWPNSISLVEAFKIRHGRIYRIEAIFTYVPYFMHSPFYVHPPLPEQAEPRAPPPDCDRDCLIGTADRFMEGLVTQNPASLRWADKVRFSENSVLQNIGEGQWGSARRKSDAALRVADPDTGQVVWYGLVYDHDAPAYFGVRLRVEGKAIADVEMFAARARNPGPFGDPAQFKIDPQLTAPVQKRASRRSLMTATRFDPACVRVENGMTVSSAASSSACEVKPGPDRVRDRRSFVVDEQLGIVVAASFADYGARQPHETEAKYPRTRELLEICKIDGGRIQRIEAVSVFQPYLMPSPWSRQEQ